MNWLDAWKRKGEEAIEAEPPAPMPAVPRPRKKPKLESLWVQIAPQRDGDPGHAETAFYTVEDGVVTLCTEEGKPTAYKQTLGPLDNPRRVAGRLRRAQWERAYGDDFNRPLVYPRIGVA